MDTRRTDIPRPLIAFMGKTMKHVDLLMRSTLMAHGIDLTPKQFIVMHMLDMGFKSQSELAVITSRDKGSLTRLIQSVERKGYIDRNCSDTDKRMNVLSLTPTGKTMLTKARPIMNGTLDAVLHGVSEAERKQMRTTLEQIFKNTLELLDSPDQ